MLKKLIIGSLIRATDLKENEIHLEIPEREEFGDYSSNVAMQLFAEFKNQKSKIKIANQNLKNNNIKNDLTIGQYGNPRELAEAITEKLRKDKELHEIVEKIEIAGAGFINFRLKKSLLLAELEKIIGSRDKYGECGAFKGKKIMVEFAHPNTHKELHVGHMRTLVLGEVLSRIFEKSGAKVFRANYQGDIGPHVAKAIWGTLKLLQEKKLSWDDAEKMNLTDRAHLLGEGYVLANREYDENKEVIDGLNTKIYQEDPPVLSDYRRTRKWSLEYYQSFYKRFGTNFDRLYFESEVADKGKKIVLANLGSVFEKSEGAIIFDGEKYGLHKRVFVTKDGNPTYEAKDMALALLQYRDFPFDLNVHVVANEQKDYFRVIIKALELIDAKFKDREYHLPMGMVNLIGKKISSRTGDIYTVDQLLDEVKSEVVPLIKDGGLSGEEKENIAEAVTLAAVKYSILKVNPEADVAFDLKQSVSLEGNSGVYLQYTYARTQSVLYKFKAQNAKLKIKTEKSKSLKLLDLSYGFDISDLRFDLNNEELSLLRSFIRFSEVVAVSAKTYSPIMLCNYLYDLAQKFNLFYQKHRILDTEALGTSKLGNSNGQKLISSAQSLVPKFRLALTTAAGQILKNGLDLLGIQAPEKM